MNSTSANKDSRRDKASKFKGVYRSGKKWKAQIQVDGKQHYLGVYDDEHTAAISYQQFAMAHGRLNIPEGMGMGMDGEDNDDTERVCVCDGKTGKQSDVYVPYLKVLLGKALHMQAKTSLEYHDLALQSHTTSSHTYTSRKEQLTHHLSYLNIHIHMLAQLCMALGEEGTKGTRKGDEGDEAGGEDNDT